MAKAGKPRFKLNKKQFETLMRQVQPDVHAHAQAVADTLRSSLPPDVPVDIRDVVGNDGRPITLVAITHPSGAARQAKDGVLTRAAAANGLEVTRYPDGG